ncbi:MAG: class I SAM-dependent methyltransferase [Gammaproteobacteria bacterium]|nr:class I SAM-dependent methyltransferase [Gammaproteobacteria bacterium]
MATNRLNILCLAALIHIVPTVHADSTGADSAVYAASTPGAASVGRRYRGREISAYKARRTTSSPAALVAALGPVDVTQVVAVGAGLVNIRLAAAAVNGRVLALELDEERFNALKEAAQRNAVGNLAGEVISADLKALPTEPVDLVVFIDSYPSLTEPHALLASLRDQLTPDGRIAIIDYRGEDPSIMVPEPRKLAQEVAEAELAAFGFKLLHNDDRLPLRHVMVFGRP